MHRSNHRIERGLLVALVLLALTTAVAWAAPPRTDGGSSEPGAWATLVLLGAIAAFVERVIEVIWDRWERSGVWPNEAGVPDLADPEYKQWKRVRSHWLGTTVAVVITGLTNVRLFQGLGIDVLFSSTRSLFNLGAGGILDGFNLGTLIDWLFTSGVIGWGGTELMHSLIEGMLKGRALLKEKQAMATSRRSVQDAEFFNTYVVPRLTSAGVSPGQLRQILQHLRLLGISQETFIDRLAAGDTRGLTAGIKDRPEQAQVAQELRVLLEGMTPRQAMQVAEVLDVLTPEQRERLLGTPLPEVQPAREPAVPPPPSPSMPPESEQPRPPSRAAPPKPTEVKPVPVRRPRTPPTVPVRPASAPHFVYGRPVQPDEFLNRGSSLRTLFNRLRHNESTAVVGEPHIGKTSLLLKLADETTRREYLAGDVEKTIISFIDLHPIGGDFTPTAFWREALEPVERHPVRDTLASLLQEAAEAGYSRRPLERLISQLAQQDLQLVLLLDEFERLLFHPNFRDPAFFALMRSLATRTGGLALITSSRLPVAAMNERGREIWHTGSPFFNNMIELRLGPFDEVTVGRLLGRAGDLFGSDDRRFIRRVAGRHPFLIQAMAATLAETDGEDRHRRAAEAFYERVAFHFDDLWRVLDDRARTTAVILSLLELGGRALGQRFAYGEIERVDAFGPELRRLAELGLAEQVGKGWQFDWQHLVLWRGERWTIGTQAFVWWVRDVIIAQSRRVPAYEEWLARKRYRLLLTQQQWDMLIGTVRNAPGWAVRGVGALARALLDELRRKE